MPNYGKGDMAARLRDLINMRHSAQAESMRPSEAEVDFSAPAFPEIEAATSAPDPDYVGPFDNTGGYSPAKKQAPPRVGQFYGRG